MGVHRVVVVLSVGLLLMLAGCAGGGALRGGVGSHRPAGSGDQSAIQPEPAPSTAAQPALEPTSLVIGHSVQSRPIEAVSLGGAGRRVLLIGGIHGDEPEGGRTIDAVLAYLSRLEPGASVRVVRDANPDGTAARTRTNARGVDLNRNWPASNFRPGGGRGSAPLSEPETRALHDEIERFDPELVLVCHAARAGPFVNFDGPAASDATRFASGAARADGRWRVVPDMGYPTPGSLGSFMGVDRGVPILTLEFARGHEAGAAWTAMRDGLGEVLGLGDLAK